MNVETSARLQRSGVLVPLSSNRRHNLERPRSLCSSFMREFDLVFGQDDSRVEISSYASFLALFIAGQAWDVAPIRQYPERECSSAVACTRPHGGPAVQLPVEDRANPGNGRQANRRYGGRAPSLIHTSYTLHPAPHPLHPTPYTRIPNP